MSVIERFTNEEEGFGMETGDPDNWIIEIWADDIQSTRRLSKKEFSFFEAFAELQDSISSFAAKRLERKRRMRDVE